MIGALIGAIAGYFAIPTTTLWGGAITGMLLGNQLYDKPKAQKKLVSKALKTEEKTTEAQLKFQRQAAGQQIALTKKQMQLQMGQQAIQTLADAILKDPEPEIVALPQRYQPGFVESINLWIDKLFRGY